MACWEAGRRHGGEAGQRGNGGQGVPGAVARHSRSCRRAGRLSVSQGTSASGAGQQRRGRFQDAGSRTRFLEVLRAEGEGGRSSPQVGGGRGLIDRQRDGAARVASAVPASSPLAEAFQELGESRGGRGPGQAAHWSRFRALVLGVHT